MSLISNDLLNRAVFTLNNIFSLFLTLLAQVIWIAIIMKLLRSLEMIPSLSTLTTEEGKNIQLLLVSVLATRKCLIYSDKNSTQVFL